MVKQTIQIFARLKPTKGRKGQYEVLGETESGSVLSFNIPRDAHDGIVNNKKEVFKFSFQRVFDVQTKQDEVFEYVAQPVINNVLEGYNGTIFAYGQTGSGKTFTITGGAERYADRGIIPRCLSYIFDYYEKNTDSEFTTSISYLEIYNENGYDLLDPKHEAAKLDDLPKVSLMEDSEQNIHLKNLSTHQASNEEEALNLLFLGDTNRMIAETPMNQASTRSHCIFTIHITSRVAGSATVHRSKLHLVDLAGSERVSKSGVNGILLTEAKYINLSLHYLEQVIIALSETRRQHIPYRNSMMTSVLRDSLGGNCMTTMIANCSIDHANIDETISTCRFAQRVALIKNEAILNEELDPKLMIDKLKREVQQLKDELSLATGEQRMDLLTDEEMLRCEELVKGFLTDNDPEAVIPLGSDLRKVNYCFNLLKKQVLEQKFAAARTQEEEQDETPRDSGTVYDTKELQQLKEIIIQRDNEIGILVNMLKKEKQKNGAIYTSEAQISSRQQRRLSASSSTSESPGPVGNRKWMVSKQTSLDSRGDKSLDEREETTKNKILGTMSLGRQEAYELFRRDYEHNESIESNKQTYKQLCTEAKQLGEQLGQSRNKINKLKSSLKQYQASLAASGSVNFENREPSHAELEMMQNLEQESVRFKTTVRHLQELKIEIEHLQHLLEVARVKLMKDFEVWWEQQTSVAEQQRTSRESGDNHHSLAAWMTPPNSASKQPHTPAFKNSPYRATDASYDDQRSINSSSSSSLGQHLNPLVGVRATTRGNASRYSTNNQIALTGDSEADADIMAFIKARQRIVQQAELSGRVRLQ